MELLGERPVWAMSGSEMLSTLDTLEAELARRQTYRLQLIARLDEIGHAQDIGAHDTAQLLAFRYRLDPPQARRDLRLALALPRYADVSAALPADVPPLDEPVESDPPEDLAPTDDEDAAADGFLRPAQAEAIVSALERVPSTVPVEDLAVAERQLVNLARHLSPGELRRAGQRIRDILDTDGPEPDEHKAYDRESLTLSTADRGVKFRGYLANENAELLRALIHAGARPHKTIDGELDPRPREKRQADALTTALTLAAKSTDTTHPKPTPTATHNRPPTAAAALSTTPEPPPTAADPISTHRGPATATATGGLPPAEPGATTGTAADGGTPVEGGAVTGTAMGGGMPTELGLATDAGVAPQSGRRPRGSDPVPGHGAKATITVTIDLEDLRSATADTTGGLVYGDNLSAAAIRRLACDANIIPLVLGSNSEPLDVGRSERLVTRAMRRALNARDKGCVVCGAPPIHCDAHHLRSWLDGGTTAIWNLVLLCRRHHIDLHAGHWTITITNGKVHVTRPTWADPPPGRTSRTPVGNPPQSSTTVLPSPSPAPAAAVPSRRPSVSADPWGDTSRAERPERVLGRADESTREEAARFAVWRRLPSGHSPPHRSPEAEETGRGGQWVERWICSPTRLVRWPLRQPVDLSGESTRGPLH